MIKCEYSEIVDINKLIGNPRNPNTHSDEQIKILAKNIKYQGFRHPIIVSKRSGFICAGHGRLMAAKKIGLATVPVDYQDFENEADEIAFLISDNKLAELAVNDPKLINDLALEMPEGFDMDLLGIPDFEIAGVEQVPGCDEDAVPESVPAVSVLGDIYELGNHRLLCGDSTSIDAVEKLMNGEKADMVFTDPPYGMNLDTDYTKLPDSPTGAKPKKWKKVEGDDSDFDPLFILSFFSEVKEIFMWGFDYYAYRLPQGTPFVWDKRVTENFDRMIGSAFELCWSKQKHKREICRLNNTLYSGEADAINKVHPTQKPIKLIEWFFERIKGDLVVDLFGGSGSTLIACEKTKRKCFMMELDPHYVDVIVSRYCKYKGTDKVIRNGEEITWKTGGKNG